MCHARMERILTAASVSAMTVTAELDVTCFVQTTANARLTLMELASTASAMHFLGTRVTTVKNQVVQGGRLTAPATVYVTEALLTARVMWVGEGKIVPHRIAWVNRNALTMESVLHLSLTLMATCQRMSTSIPSHSASVTKTTWATAVSKPVRAPHIGP